MGHSVRVSTFQCIIHENDKGLGTGYSSAVVARQNSLAAEYCQVSNLCTPKDYVPTRIITYISISSEIVYISKLRSNKS